jgi:hypothetical protein
MNSTLKQRRKPSPSSDMVNRVEESTHLMEGERARSLSGLGPPGRRNQVLSTFRWGHLLAILSFLVGSVSISDNTKNLSYLRFSNLIRENNNKVRRLLPFLTLESVERPIWID